MIFENISTFSKYFCTLQNIHNKETFLTRIIKKNTVCQEYSVVFHNICTQLRNTAK